MLARGSGWENSSAFLSIGTNEYAILIGTLAYFLRSSLYGIFANGTRSVPLLACSPCSTRSQTHPLLWGRRIPSRTARSKHVKLILARLDNPYRRLGHFIPCSDDISQRF